MRRASQLEGHRLRGFVAWVFVILALSGCPQQSEPPTRGGPDMQQRLDMPADLPVDMPTISEDMRLPDRDMMVAPDMAADMPRDASARVMTLALDVDDDALWPAPRQGREHVFMLSESRAGEFEGVIQWPAGRHRVRLELGGQVWFPTSDRTTGLARQDDALVAGEATAPERARIFSPAGEEVTVRVSLERRQWSVVLPDAPAEVHPWDAPDRTTAGIQKTFDDTIYALNTGAGPADEAAIALMHTLREAGAGPVPVETRADGGVSLFVGPCPAGEPPVEVRGTFTGWQASDATRFAEIVPGLCGRYIAHGPREQYKLVFNGGAAWFTDLSNRHIAWDGQNTGGVGAFNSVVSTATTPDPAGRMVWLRGVASAQLGNSRDVYVWLPPQYDQQPTTRFPTMYLHDGNESISRSQLHEVFAAQAADRNDPVVGVFIHLPTQDVRIAEYTMATADARGDLYAAFVTDTLVPLIDGRFRTRADRAARGLAGASLGGLISYHIASGAPQVFEYAAGMSSSFWWEDRWMIQRIDALGCQGLTYYLDSGNGGASQDGAPDTRLMRDTLDRLGCPYTHVEEDGATHDWFFWKGRFPGVLDAFRAVHSRPAP